MNTDDATPKRRVGILSLDQYTAEELAEMNARIEEARRRSVEAYSASPLYRERAARNPNYWKTFSSGHVNWSKRPQEAEPESGASAAAGPPHDDESTP